jgi:hypothetical protein
MSRDEERIEGRSQQAQTAPLARNLSSTHRRIRAAFVRSAADTSAEVGQDVRVIVPVAVVVALIGLAISGFEWDLATVAVLTTAILGYPAGWVGFFLKNLIFVLRHPDQHRSWSRQSPTVAEYEDSRQLRLTLLPTAPVYVGRSKCEVRHPDGTVWSEPETAHQPILARNLHCEYPMQFPGAPPLVCGSYEIRWFLGTKKGKWHEILRHKETITLE